MGIRRLVVGAGKAALRALPEGARREVAVRWRQRFPIDDLIAAEPSLHGVYLRADQGVNYGLVVQLLAILNKAGITNVGLVTEPEEIR